MKKDKQTLKDLLELPRGWIHVADDLPDHNQKVLVNVDFENDQKVNAVLVYKHPKHGKKEKGVFIDSNFDAWPFGDEPGQINFWQPIIGVWDVNINTQIILVQQKWIEELREEIKTMVVCHHKSHTENENETYWNKKFQNAAKKSLSIQPENIEVE